MCKKEWLEQEKVDRKRNNRQRTPIRPVISKQYVLRRIFKNSGRR